MASIVGVGETPVGKLPGVGATDLYALAIREAVADAGVSFSSVDMLITANSRSAPYLYHAEAMAEYLGLRPDHCLTLGTGASTTAMAVATARNAVESGEANVCVIAMADSLRTGLGRDGAVENMATASHPVYEHQHGATVPALYALLAQRYFHDYGIKPADVACVSVTNRYHAGLHGGAHFQDPLTADDVLDSRLIADPLRLLDCAPVSDGGCAIVVVADERAGTGDSSPVSVLGVASACANEHISQARSLTESVARYTGEKALKRAGRSISDVGVACIYDPFSFMMCMDLEDLGFCGKGEGAAFVAAGETRLGGRLPTNTHGGLLSHSHAGRPSGLFLIVEAVRQLRGEGGRRQVPCDTALVHVSGGMSSSHGTLVLGSLN